MLPVDHNDPTGGTIMAADTDKQQKENGLKDYGIIYISGAIIHRKNCGRQTSASAH